VAVLVAVGFQLGARWCTRSCRPGIPILKQAKAEYAKLQ